VSAASSDNPANPADRDDRDPREAASDAAGASTDVAVAGSVSATPPAPVAPGVPPATAAVVTSTKKWDELPLDELRALAEEFGLEPDRYPTRQHAIAAINERKQLIATFDRASLLDIVRWGRRPVASNASKEQLAIEAVKIKSMRFAGLSEGGLRTLAKIRGVQVPPDEPIQKVLKRLQKQEGLFARFARKRRAWVGGMVARMIGERSVEEEYQFLPAAPTTGGSANALATDAARQASLKEEIEEAGLLGGLTSRLKRSADSYLNQKLDEIEARIDRKLDEIDRRLAEWRDKEVANRLKIMKITLWVSVAVAGVSLLFSYVKVYLAPSKPAANSAQVQQK
jgi:hypothetical protein